MKTLLEYPILKEGYLMRPVTMDDLIPVLELMHICSMAMTGTKEGTLDDLKKEWTSPGFNQETDQRVVVSPQGLIVGFSEVWATDEIPVHPWVWTRVHPDYIGQGFNAALLNWAELRASWVIERVPAKSRVSMWSGSLSTYQPAIDALIAFRMEVIRHSFRMRIEMEQLPPEPLWADGITLRTFDGSDQQLKAIYTTDDEAFQDHFGYVAEPFESGFEKFRHFMTNNETFDPELWFLAMDGDEIAGIALCRKRSHDEKDVGWVISLAVRRPWRKRGIGLALLQHSFRAFWERGKHKVGLGVDAENLTGALRLYEKAGMHVHHQFDLYEKELRPGKELSKITLED
jgi:mycothiol synthase